ncbi:MAG: aminotransferase class I/II-fold pyridoxal phosphate-dependent enzyme [Bacteroidota bacterium]|nr:aminotransferase class I/II-fold pyridoxal phosphate-dependent enzyme [Bacteroidota bacterium]
MIKSKFINTGKDIFALIAELTNNSEIINLAKASTDFLCPEELKKLAIKFLQNDYNHYAHTDGVFELRDAIAQQIAERFNINFNPSNEVIITAGATQAIYTTISTFITEGDEVVLFEPACKSYVSAIESNGGRPVFVQLKHPEYSIDWEAAQKIINTRTKLIIVNSPHNPTGTLFSENDIAQLQKITNGTKINILSDESFENIIYGSKKHISVLSNTNLAEKSIVVSSLGKTFNVPGWKIGYCLAGEKLMAQIRKKQQFQINAVNTPLQYAFAEYLNKGFDKNELLKEYDENRKLVSQIFYESPFEFIPSQSTYFQLLSYNNVCDLKDTEFVQKIMDNYGVALFPMSVFYHDYVDHKMVGLNFALNKEVLIEAANRLKNLKQKL